MVRHECLAIRVARKLKAIDVIDVLSDLFILRGVPGHIRSDKRPEFVAKVVQEWITAVGVKTAYIEPGSPWENGYVEPSSKVGGATSIQSGRLNRSATSYRHPKCSCQHPPRGRLRYVDRLRRPRSRWRNGQL
jgi:hypothetical protein